MKYIILNNKVKNIRYRNFPFKIKYTDEKNSKNLSKIKYHVVPI